MSDERLRIFRGQDKSFLIRVINTRTKDPYSLTGATLIQVIFEKEDRTKLVLSNVVKPAIKAQNEYQNVLFTALVAGAEGNGINLIFNGVDTLDTVVSAWNTANPSNGVEHNSTDGTLVLTSGSVQLINGYQSYTPVSVFGNPDIGKIQVTIAEKETYLLRTGIGKSFTTVIDKGDNPAGVRNVGTFEQKVDIKESYL